MNTLSHDFAMNLITQAIDKEVNVKKVFLMFLKFSKSFYNSAFLKVFLDTVGPADKYKEKLERNFPDLEFVVSKKADSLYTVVSAASICAKVIRDRIVSNWKFREGDFDGKSYGSGYPSGEISSPSWMRYSLIFQIFRSKNEGIFEKKSRQHLWLSINC